MYDIGDLIRIETEIYSGTSLIDPDTVQLEVREPDGLLQTYTYSGGDVIRNSAGIFYRNHYLSKSGQYWYRWYASGSVIVAEEDDVIVKLKVTQ